ncbi:MAG: lactate utilization protein B [Miltoncostaeaceae bacterium]
MSTRRRRASGGVAYPDAEGTLRERTVQALADDTLRGNLETAATSWGESRDAMQRDHGLDAMRDRARDIRRRNIRELPALLSEMQAKVREAGGTVVRAQDGAEAARYITGLARARGVTVVAKSKSMATEEIKLNESLTDAGIEVVETDLGEWILQLAGERPSHIIAPAVHLNRGQVAALFREEAGTDDVPDDREGLVAHARVRLREKFAQAGMGVSGVNLGVVSTGTVCIVENEGNARLVTSQPRIHVAVMGMERVVADWDEAAHILQVLPMAAIGQDAANYVNLITGPRREGEADGPEEFHLVIVDGGRGSLRGTEFEEALSCIRCGACLYSCPMWKSVGGQAYGSPYSGPIGAVITPLLEGPASPASRDLPFMSSLCGACGEACPVGIPLQDLLVRARARASSPATRRSAVAFRAWSRLWRRPTTYRAWMAGLRLMLRARGKGGWATRLPGPGAGWTQVRDMPSRWPPRP